MLLKNARVINPETNFDEIVDILINDGIIQKISSNILSEDSNVVDLTGKIIIPGMIDMHCHLREPGYTSKESIKTGIESAIAGGYTAICPMANTNPVNDNTMTLRYVIDKAKEAGMINFFPVCALTKNLEGQKIVNIAQLIDLGAIAFSDDGKPVENMNLLKIALEYAKSVNALIISHSEDSLLAAGGVINEGYISSKFGLKGISELAESTAVARELEIVRKVNAAYHFAHISVKRSLELIRQAKSQGYNITCETAPHYFSLSQDDLKPYDSRYKMNPPLRSNEDVEEVLKALQDGTIDVIATDHAPHTVEEKMLPIQTAPMGIAGFETSLGLVMTNLFHKNILTLNQIVEKLSINPAKILGLKDYGTIKEGNKANLTIIDLEKEWVVDSSKFKSKCRISPFDGIKLKGQAYAVIVNGKFQQIN